MRIFAGLKLLAKQFLVSVLARCNILPSSVVVATNLGLCPNPSGSQCSEVPKSEFKNTSMHSSDLFWWRQPSQNEGVTHPHLIQPLYQPFKSRLKFSVSGNLSVWRRSRSICDRSEILVSAAVLFLNQFWLFFVDELSQDALLGATIEPERDRVLIRTRRTFFTWKPI